MPLAWDHGAPWKFQLQVERDAKGKNWQIWGSFIRDSLSIPVSEPLLILCDGLMIMPDLVARLDVSDAEAWIQLLRTSGPVVVPANEAQALLDELWQMPALPEVSLPEELRWEQVRPEPRPRITVTSPPAGSSRPMGASVSFDYDGQVIAASELQLGVVDRQHKRVLLRDRAREREALESLKQLGLKPAPPQHPHDVLIPAKDLPTLVETLAGLGWYVEAEGHRIRQPGACHLSVSSQVDWFELTGSFEFEGARAGMPQLLAALSRGDRFVQLDDGSHGMLPESWLAQYGALAGLGEVEGDHVRFTNTQAAILDALLAAQENVNVDERFQEFRQRLHSFHGIEPLGEPELFTGELRGYQRDGLGWLDFLGQFGFGGCLADDMGLGKTVQVLATNGHPVEMGSNGSTRKQSKSSEQDEQGDHARPSLVIVPRSLVHNWIEEAARFTPNLKVLDYTGLAREALVDEFQSCHLIVTTYGTLRRDVLKLKDIPFEYVILDEAQAIKNANSQAAKACRLLDARHRLAMTGTPVENHLGELWSIFEFLNPGMLGRSSAFRLLSTSAVEADQEDSGLRLLARALRPFILRRTKGQVLTELPEKTEQTLYCEMDDRQRKLYNELRDHYRASLNKKIDSIGLNRSKIHVLEALLRLRQAACHP